VTLYHYTCDHGHGALLDEPLVRVPADHTPEVIVRTPQWYEPLIRLSWFTDLPEPNRQGLGLTMSRPESCDRAVYRWRVLDETQVTRWTEHVREDLGAAALREALERTPGAMPAHWWVATGPVKVVFDPR
jgi:hypothetical protein